MELERIESLLKLMQTYDVAQLCLEDSDGSIELQIAIAGATVAHAQVSAVPASPIAAAAAQLETSSSSTAIDVKTPMVGTFYRAPKPGVPPFANVGDTVSSGQVLCIIEAMKLMNEIESEVTGTIVEILVENAQPVQFGQVLFRIEPN